MNYLENSATDLHSKVQKQDAQPVGQIHLRVIYFVLAILNLSVLIGSLFLNHNVMKTFEFSISEDKAWTTQLSNLRLLNKAIMVLGQGPNSVFISHDPEKEHSHLIKAHSQLEKTYFQVLASSKSLADEAAKQELEKLFVEFKSQESQLYATYEQVLTLYSKNGPAKAAELQAKASLDQNRLIQILRDIHKTSVKHHQDALKVQQANVAFMGSLESLLTLIVMIVLSGILVYGYILTVRLRQREEAIKKANWRAQRFRNTLNQAAIITVTDLHGRITQCNHRFEEVSGYSREEVIGKHHRLVNSGFHSPEFWKEFWATINSGKIFRGEVCNRAKDGTIYWVDTQVIPQTDSLGNIIEFIAIRQDISERKRAEERIFNHQDVLDSIGQIQRSFLEGRDTGETLNFLLDKLLTLTVSEYGYIGEVFYSGDTPYLKAQAFTNIAWDEASREKFGEAVADGGLDFHNLDNLIGSVIKNDEFVISNEPSKDPRSGGLPPGHPPLNAYLGIPIRFGDRLLGSIGLANREGGYDMAVVEQIQPYLEACALFYHALEERRKIEDAHRLLEEAQASAKMGSWTMDVNNNNITWSSQMYKVFDFDDPKDGTVPSLEDIRSRIHPDDVENYDRSLAEAIQHGRSQLDEFRIVRRDGSVSHILGISRGSFSEAGKITGLHGTCQDHTDIVKVQKELEMERHRLIQAAKMATLGEMAGGVAHEINNPLAIIHGFSDQLRALSEMNKLDHDKVTLVADKVSGQVMRIKKIVDGLRTFARDGEADRMIETPARKILDGTLELCRNRFNNHQVELRTDFPDSLPSLSCREVQVSQVLLNLLSNAHDSIVDSESEERWVEVSCKDLGDRVEFRVSDSGPKVSNEKRESIFRPFYTTKEVGEGSGLGLSISKGITENHKGRLYYDGAEGQKSFVLVLPKDPATVEQNEAPGKAA